MQVYAAKHCNALPLWYDNRNTFSLLSFQIDRSVNSKMYEVLQGSQGNKA